MKQFIKNLAKAILPDTIVKQVQKRNRDKAEKEWYFSEVIPQLPDEPERAAEYETKSQELMKRYKRIELCKMIAYRFGDTIAIFGEQYEFPSLKDELTLFIPVGWVPNKDGVETLQLVYPGHFLPNDYLLMKIAEKIPVLEKDKGGFWRYFLTKYWNRAYLSDRFDFGPMLDKNKELHRTKAFRRQYLSFTDEEERKGKEEFHKMGLKREYVCFFARNPEFLKVFLHYEDTSAGNFARNSSIQNFSLMAQRMDERGVQSVRMGYLMGEQFEPQGVIDYATKYHSPFMDLYLSGHAKFFVAGFSAILSFASLYDKPVVMVNVPVMTFNADGLNWCDRARDIFLPKKMYDTVNKRYLTFKEIFTIERQEDSRYKIAEYYDAHGIVLEENTPEEIADAAEEMLERLNGTFTYTPEDEARQKRFSELLAWACEGRDCFVVDLPVGRNFLRQNEWILK